MLIPAQEFIELTKPHGMTNCAIKGIMSDIVNKLSPIYLTKDHARKVYLLFDHSDKTIQCYTGTERDLPDDDNMTFTEAFKLLARIAD